MLRIGNTESVYYSFQVIDVQYGMFNISSPDVHGTLNQTHVFEYMILAFALQ